MLPILNQGVSDFSISVGAPLITKTVSASDPENKPVRIIITSAYPNFMSFDSMLTMSFYSPFSLTSRSAVVTYTLTDDVNEVGPYSFTVSVVNDPPIINQHFTDFTVSTGVTAPVVKNILVSDPEGAPL